MTHNEILIAVMGVTGSGKSSFVNLLLGEEQALVGHSLHAQTSEVASYEMRVGNRKITLIDTPGFDDTNKTDTQILRILCQWLSQSYSEGKMLNAIFYLQRITDNRFPGSAMRSVRTFQRLCGPEFRSSIILGTTFWSQTKGRTDILEAALLNEKELRTTDGFWKEMIAGGSKMIRLPEEQGQARKLVMKVCDYQPRELQVQVEQDDRGLEFGQTAAARSIDPDLTRAQEEHQRRRREKAEQLAKEEKKKTAAASAEKARIAAALKKQQQEQVEAEEKKAAEERLQKARIKAAKAAQKELEEQENMYQAKLEKLRRDEERRRKMIRFREWVDDSVQTIERTVASGLAVQGLRHHTNAYTLMCDNCFANIGCGTYKRCPFCDTTNGFDLCESCYSNGATCDVASHVTSYQHKIQSDRQGDCARVVDPPNPRTTIDCTHCLKAVDVVYFHCCACDSDNFDMCMRCWTSGETCRNSYHDLDICSRYHSSRLGLALGGLALLLHGLVLAR